MAYDLVLADRMREVLLGTPGLVEKKMFGGLGFFVNGNMACGIIGDELMLRVGSDLHDSVVARPYAREMEFTGRPMRGMLVVGTAGYPTQEELKEWIDIAVGANAALPVREFGQKKKAKKD